MVNREKGAVICPLLLSEKQRTDELRWTPYEQAPTGQAIDEGR